MKATLLLAFLGVWMFSTAADAQPSDDPVRTPLLLKVGGEWKIANKVYAARRTAE